MLAPLAPAELRRPRDPRAEPPGWRLWLCGWHGQAGAASLRRPETSQAQARRPAAFHRRPTHLPSAEAMKRATLAGTQLRGGGAAWRGRGEKVAGESRKADYLNRDAETRRRLQPFPVNGRGGGPASEEEGSADTGRWSRWNPAPVSCGGHSLRASSSEDCGGHRREGGESCSSVSARSPPPLFSRAGGVERHSDASCFWGGRGHPTLDGVLRP